MTDVGVILIIVLIVVVIWRGPKTLPAIGAMFGRGVREARREANKGDEQPEDKTAS